ncbi:hypothetical protein ES703_90410 [subsurface metagenome]
MFYILPAVLLILFLSAAVKILRECGQGVVFRLGSVLKMPKGSGLVIIIPVIDRLRRVSLRLVTIDVPPQDVITEPIPETAVKRFLLLYVTSIGRMHSSN